jgi:hypothetical protein
VQVQVSTDWLFRSNVRYATVTTSQWTVSPALGNNTLYYWRVRAKNCGIGPWSVVRSFRTAPCVTPAAPTLVSPSNGAIFAYFAPLLNWNDASGAISYDVQVSQDSTFVWIARSATVTTSQWTVSPCLAYNTYYYWRVRAKNACGTFGPWSAVWSFKTLPICPLPGGPTLVSPANGQPEFLPCLH